MNEHVRKLNLLEQEAQQLTGNASQMEQEQQEQEQQEEQVNLKQIAPTLQALFDWCGINIDGLPDYYILEQMALAAQKRVADLLSERSRVIERNKSLREELKKMQELYGKLPKAKKQGGRKRKEVNWEQYDLLKKAGLSEKQVAEYMHIGVSTLRRYRAEHDAK